MECGDDKSKPSRYNLASTESLRNYFFCDCMLEDTSTSHKEFLDNGRTGVYIPPPLNMRRQYALGIAKKTENFVEGLEVFVYVRVSSPTSASGNPKCREGDKPKILRPHEPGYTGVIIKNGIHSI